MDSWEAQNARDNGVRALEDAIEAQWGTVQVEARAPEWIECETCQNGRPYPDKSRNCHCQK